MRVEHLRRTAPTVCRGMTSSASRVVASAAHVKVVSRFRAAATIGAWPAGTIEHSDADGSAGLAVSPPAVHSRGVGQRQGPGKTVPGTILSARQGEHSVKASGRVAPATRSPVVHRQRSRAQLRRVHGGAKCRPSTQHVTGDGQLHAVGLQQRASRRLCPAPRRVQAVQSVGISSNSPMRRDHSDALLKDRGTFAPTGVPWPATARCLAFAQPARASLRLCSTLLRSRYWHWRPASGCAGGCAPWWPGCGRGSGRPPVAGSVHRLQPEAAGQTGCRCRQWSSSAGMKGCP